MHNKTIATGSALSIYLLAAIFSNNAAAQNEEPGGGATPPIDAIESTGPQLHPSMRQDAGIYANRPFLAYIKGPDDNANRIAERGLFALASQAYIRSSLELGGVVGLNIEEDDLSLFNYIYWPVTERTPMLSQTAADKIQNYLQNGSLLNIDVVGGTTLRSSSTLSGILQAIQPPPLQPIDATNILTQTFYLTDGLPGVKDRPVYTERIAKEFSCLNSTDLIIGDQNWAGAWSAITVGPDVAEDAIRSGLNMLYLAYMGTYKCDEIHQDTITAKRKYREDHKKRLREAQEAARTTPAPTAPE